MLCIHILKYIHLHPGKVAIPVLWLFFDAYPTADVTRNAYWKDIAKLISTLGLHVKRAKMIVRFSGNV